MDSLAEPFVVVGLRADKAVEGVCDFCELFQNRKAKKKGDQAFVLKSPFSVGAEGVEPPTLCL